MNKQEFLDELRTRIQILEDIEQQDILAEYAQHIDLRTAAGLTEEEAIRDFGDPAQLASEILEAYHVDPSRLRSHPSASEWLSRSSGRLRQAAVRVGASFHRAGRGLAAGMRRMWQRAAGCLRRFAGRLRQLFHRRPTPPPAPCPDPIKEGPSMIRTSKMPRTHTFSAGLGRIFHGLVHLLAALVRLAWDLLLVLIGIPFAVAGMLSLLGIGLLLVLILQGYPLAGPLLCLLGGVLCCAALLCLDITLIRREGRSERSRSAGVQETAPAPIADSDEEVVPHA